MADDAGRVLPVPPGENGPPASFVTIGRIVRPQGNRGEVVIASETDRGEARFQVGATVFAWRNGRPDAMVVRESREAGGRWVVGFEGVSTIDAAETLRGIALVVPESALPSLEDGRFYLHDLTGCEVETTDGTRVGEVVRVDREVGTPLLIVATPRGEVMVPFAEAICRRIDVAGKRITIDPPEGLLEL